jgi:hypothetical protein
VLWRLGDSGIAWLGGAGDLDGELGFVSLSLLKDRVFCGCFAWVHCSLLSLSVFISYSLFSLAVFWVVVRGGLAVNKYNLALFEVSCPPACPVLRVGGVRCGCALVVSKALDTWSCVRD